MCASCKRSACKRGRLTSIVVHLDARVRIAAVEGLVQEQVGLLPAARAKLHRLLLHPEDLAHDLLHAEHDAVGVLLRHAVHLSHWEVHLDEE